MPARSRKLNLSPSIVHHRVMREIVPSDSYDGGDVRKWQQRLRRKVRRLVGDTPGPRCDLNVRTLWRRPHRLGSIEKLAFTAEPGADVVACLCIPKKSEPPHRCFIAVQGHSTGMHNSISVSREDDSVPIKVPGGRDYGLECMRRGVAALCIEQRAFGEREENAQKDRSVNRCWDASMHALMLGRTLIGERVYDVDRGIDYLASRGDMDMSRLGVLGNSGGGTTTMFAAALLPRVRVAMPSCYFSSFKDSIMSLCHCVCNYIPGILKVAEMADVMGLFAPKPVVVVAGEEDRIFPIEATRREFRRLKGIYRAAGAADRCHLVVGKQGHRFYPRPAWPVMLKELDRMEA